MRRSFTVIHWIWHQKYYNIINVIYWIEWSFIEFRSQIYFLLLIITYKLDLTYKPRPNFLLGGWLSFKNIWHHCFNTSVCGPNIRLYNALLIEKQSVLNEHVCYNLHRKVIFMGKYKRFALTSEERRHIDSWT